MSNYSDQRLQTMTNANIDKLIDSGDMKKEILEGLIRVGKLTQAQYNAKVAAKQALFNQRMRNFATRRATRIVRGMPGLAATIARARAATPKKNVIAKNIAKSIAKRANLQNILVDPPQIPDEMWDEEPQTAQLLLNSHQENIEKKKKQALQQFKYKTSLESLRTNTNESTKDFIRKLHETSKYSRPTFVILAKLDDLYGKLGRNLDIAETDGESQLIASKKFEVNELRKKVKLIMERQYNNPSYKFPPTLMSRVEAVLQGENVAGVLAGARTFVIQAKLNDVLEQLKRNLGAAASNAERQQITQKKDEIDNLIKLVETVEENQMEDPSYSFPADLMTRIEAALEGVNMEKLFETLRPAANRLAEVIPLYEAAKDAKYTPLRNQMNAMIDNSQSREKVVLLGAIEDILEIVQAQPEPPTNAQKAILAAELAELNEMKRHIEQAIQNKTKIDYKILGKLFKKIEEYRVDKKISNGLYARLNKNRYTFNRRNLIAYHEKYYKPNSMIPILKNEFVGPNKNRFGEPYLGQAVALAQPAALTGNQMRAARVAALSGKGGRRTRRHRKN